jgi:tetratricopeptide (TPR) repeat protein
MSTNLSIALWTNRWELNSVADTALKVATRFWFAVTVIGQVVFALAVATFYGRATLRGDSLAWNRFMTHGYVPGDRVGNAVAVTHVIAAVVIMLAGATQLVPQIRGRFPVFHRWNGRIYMLVAVTTAAAGIYMTWIRGGAGDASQHMGSSLNAVLIWIFAALALCSALARDFKKHRRWALRLFLVVSAAWFFRIGFFLTMLVFQRPIGFDPITPLGILELYLRAKDRGDDACRIATAFGLALVTVAMGAGIFGIAMYAWVPSLEAPFAQRKSIADTLGATLSSGGIDQAIQQYRELKATAPSTYNFSEGELNGLGYELLHTRKFTEAIAVLQLNVEAYPHSGDAYDSLAEAYLDDGNQAQAIANYQKSLELNPKNTNAERMLEKLRAP